MPTSLPATAPAPTGFVQVALAAMRGDVQADDARRGRTIASLYDDLRLLHPKGSAGRAIGWFEEEAAAHPTASPSELVELFAERCDGEYLLGDFLYTKGHILRIIEIAGTVAERFQDES